MSSVKKGSNDGPCLRHMVVDMIDVNSGDFSRGGNAFFADFISSHSLVVTLFVSLDGWLDRMISDKFLAQLSLLFQIV